MDGILEQKKEQPPTFPDFIKDVKGVEWFFRKASDWLIRLLLIASLVVFLYDRVQIQIAASKIDEEAKKLQGTGKPK